ncbi:hypothetical protein DPMN_124740 [Dreissena polymorpha]|uniref:Uncharacterized protein n=1 Tax=Dreissena polymorpha TaxID=45954 RepID=A0A9D4GSN3_DREPO|nr:hypothetical protein DPMN_124740 [Dreissena polymorpha]
MDILSRLVFSVSALQNTIETKATTNISSKEVTDDSDREDVNDLDALMASKQTDQTETVSVKFLRDSGVLR